MLLTRGQCSDRERARELLASARQSAEALDLVRLKKKLELVSVGDEAQKEGAEVEADSPTGVGIRSEEAGDIEALVASAISRARDLSAQPPFAGPITILFSDIVDSTSLYETLGDLRAHEVVRIHNEIFRQQVAAYGGQEVKALGDSFMIAFPSARRAALCAIALQRSFAAYCENHPDPSIRVRIGLHVGEAISESSDYFGKAVILAARIATLAEGGQILVSSTLHDLAGDAGDLRFAPMGERQLKGLAGTHRIFAIAW
jgi:class 3 adenylate cyclase